MRGAFPGRERLVLARVADTMLEGDPEWTPQASRRLAKSIDDFMESCTRSVRWSLRLAVLAFEWGGLWLKTRDNRFEHFTRMSPAGRRRALRLWMHHPASTIRDIAFFLKTIVYCLAYDEFAR